MNPLQNILIVDDDQTNLEILTSMLNGDQHIQTAASGEEALATLDTFLPNIVLLDIMMPGIDGYEVCRIMRTEKRLTDTKILLITALSAMDDRLKGYEAGADDYITKPFDERELLAKVNVFKRLNVEENKRKEFNRRLLLRQQDIPNMLWECDINLCFTYADEHSVAILGYSPEELLGRPISDFLAQENTGEFYFKFLENTHQIKPQIKGLSLNFLSAEGMVTPFRYMPTASRTPSKPPLG